MERVCLTSFIYGEKYQQYLPLLLYSINKSYPEYDVVIFVYEHLSPVIKESLTNHNLLNKYRIIENAFAECEKMTPLLSQTLRWTLWDSSFEDYDYIYIIDIDIIYVKEPIPLHVQHLTHMQVTGLCYDNMRRVVKRKRTPFALARRFKYARFKSFLKYLWRNHTEYRATGLHFVRVKDYYSMLTVDKLNSYREDIINGRWLNYVMIPNDEVFLYHILGTEGLHPEKLAIQSNSYSSLDFNNPERSEFRPHHGIHLGTFRGGSDNYYEILNSPTYSYYAKMFREHYFHDPVFVEIIEESPDFIKSEVKKLTDYYAIN